MKISLAHSMLFLSVVLLLACTKKIGIDSDEWPEMDSFHMVMAEAFHPYKDSANVEPAKRLAEELALEAQRWQSAALPGKVDNEEVKGQLEKLKTGSRALADQIKAGGSDEEIGASLTALHDQFHKIVEAWYGAEPEHQH